MVAEEEVLSIESGPEEPARKSTMNWGAMFGGASARDTLGGAAMAMQSMEHPLYSLQLATAAMRTSEEGCRLTVRMNSVAGLSRALILSLQQAGRPALEAAIAGHNCKTVHTHESPTRQTGHMSYIDLSLRNVPAELAALFPADATVPVRESAWLRLNIASRGDLTCICANVIGRLLSMTQLNKDETYMPMRTNTAPSMLFAPFHSQVPAFSHSRAAQTTSLFTRPSTVLSNATEETPPPASRRRTRTALIEEPRRVSPRLWSLRDAGPIMGGKIDLTGDSDERPLAERLPSERSPSRQPEEEEGRTAESRPRSRCSSGHAWYDPPPIANPQLLFVYPDEVDHAGGGGDSSTTRRPIVQIPMTEAEASRLDGLYYLNDRLVDFSMAHTLQTQPGRALRDRVHIYSGLFYPALRDDLKQAAEEGRGAVVGGGRGGGEELAWRRTMTFSPTSVDPFAFDFLLVPVCEHLHWYLAVVCHPRRLLRCSGALLNGIIDLSGEEEAACIAIVDSLSSSGRRSKQLTDMLRRWLCFEHQRRPSPPSDVASQHGGDHGGVAGAAPEHNVDLAEPACTTVHVKMPLQTNVVDCGLFVCMNAMHIVRDLDVWYREAVVEGADLRGLYDPKVASGYRQILQHHMAHFASLYAQRHPAEPAAALGLSSDVEEIPGFSQ